jgi:hypothetical protein
MNIKLSALQFGAALALMGSAIMPAMADEWNKEIRLQVSAPVEIPGRVLAPGKYIFRVADSLSDRQIVQVFSEDENGNQKLLATLFTVPKFTLNTPDKPVFRLDERHAGTPEAIRSWFYPGDNTGWEFVYPKSERLEVASTPAPTPVEQPAPAPAPAPTTPQIEAPPTVTEVQVEEQVVIAENEVPLLVPAPADDEQNSADRSLPQTAGYSGVELMAGLSMLGLGLLFFWLRRSEA